MRRLTITVGLVTLCAAIWLSGTIGVRQVPSPAQSSRVLLSHELDQGKFGIYDGTNTHPVAYMWVRDESGVRKETWVMLRCGSTDGWTYPGSDATDENWNVKYLGTASFASNAAFMQWCEGEYDDNFPLLQVGLSDFTVHLHTVTTL